MTRRDRIFQAHWILANAVAEGLGLSITLLSALIASGLAWSNPASPGLLLGAVSILVAGSLSEGALAGYAQAEVLAPRLPQFQRRRWVCSTAVGTCAAWLLGLLAASSIGELMGPWAPPDGTTTWPVFAAAAVCGAFAGGLRAVPQWLALRPLVRNAWRWVPANAIGWWLGATVLLAGLDRLAWTGGFAGVLDGVFFVCAAAGAVAGAVHGRLLHGLLPTAAGGLSNSRPSPAAGSTLHG